jgi:hypothetical protein
MIKKQGKNTEKFGSCPVRRTALLSTFNSLGFPWIFGVSDPLRVLSIVNFLRSTL